jgi:hypothetical protein
LAQLNVARMLEPLDSPALAGFVDALEPINALADASSGFVWRLKDNEDESVANQSSEDDMLLVNLSVWETIDSLRNFVYQSAHAPVMRKRRRWFQMHQTSSVVLWWITAGHRPSVEEAFERLMILQRDGPSRQAFTFTTCFPCPDE